eukprot:9739779-Prorocentrum_lima.AAC.1
MSGQLALAHGLGSASPVAADPATRPPLVHCRDRDCCWCCLSLCPTSIAFVCGSMQATASWTTALPRAAVVS